tara:strand:- start:318 stop:674 length:357 start_codon:yes stop_codon:yes gene_type:complete
MIYQGKQGSICFYYKNVLISGFGLSKKKTLEAYLYQGDHLIKQSKGINIKDQIKMYIHFCNVIHKRKLNKQRIQYEDHIYFISCLSALLRLRIIENDDANGFLVCPRKPKNKKYSLRY